jgi:hypothetical protein
VTFVTVVPFAGKIFVDAIADVPVANKCGVSALYAHPYTVDVLKNIT